MRKHKEARGIKNENKAPQPPCGQHHAGRCRLSKNCSLSHKENAT